MEKFGKYHSAFPMVPCLTWSLQENRFSSIQQQMPTTVDKQIDECQTFQWHALLGEKFGQYRLAFSQYYVACGRYFAEGSYDQLWMWLRK